MTDYIWPRDYIWGITSKVKTPLWYWQNGKSDPEVAPLLLGGGENKRGAAFVTSGEFSISTFGCRYLWGRLSEKELPGKCRRCDAQSADGENGALLWLRRIDRKPVGTHALMLLASNCVSASCSPQGRFVCRCEHSPQAVTAQHKGKHVHYVHINLLLA